jgi:hypothetical protein
MIEKLTEADCRFAMKSGEFSNDIVGSARFVAVVLTQSWCPQWVWMRSYLDGMAKNADTAIFWLEYNKEPFFEQFLEFKENIFGNMEVPYVRYYREGVLERESNFTDKGGFLAKLRG